ncbi:MAG: imidazoleglycerol-phosphate dehydratase [Longimicrobiales bacterium]
MTTMIRESRETTVHVRLQLAAETEPSLGVHTPYPFLDHMLTTLARYAGLALHIEASGDLRHHVVEDVAITLGCALREEIPTACSRYGHAVIPMDDALVEASLDAGGRAWYEGRLPSLLYEHFFRSFAHNAGITLHLRVRRGRDRHHIVEAAFKAAGLALRAALQPTGAVFSTKGAVVLQRERPGVQKATP